MKLLSSIDKLIPEFNILLFFGLILFSDKLFEGVVIKLGKNFNKISKLAEDKIIAGSIVIDKNLSEFARENAISGFEFLSCIPGTDGGGIRMNSGCYGSEFKDIVLSVQAVDYNGNIITCLLYTSPSPRDRTRSRMPSSA